MSSLPQRTRTQFEAVRQALIVAGALPSNALQLSCPDTADAIIPRLLRTGADAESISLALSTVFGLPLYVEGVHGALEYAEHETVGWADGRIFVSDPFACEVLIRNPQLALPEEWLRHYQGDIGLLPIPAHTHTLEAHEASSSHEAERILNEWIELAIEHRASDIHITPRDNDSVEIKIRRNGMLQTVREERMTMSEKCNYRLISNTLLSLSGNQHGVYNTPRDGNMELPLRGRLFFIRVNMSPVTIGRRIWGSFTLRIVGGYQHTVQTLEQLALPPTYVRNLHRVAERNSGLFLLTGPTGSGKTTTFYAVIMEILRRTKNQVSVKTLEDPIEVQVPGIDQIQINSDIGMSYAAGLRALLRADPDVILIGEIRDEETAALAARASLTGHLVLSTLHTQNSLGAIDRLRNLGVSSHLIADTLTAVGAQRLARQVCPSCVRHGRDTASEDACQRLSLPYHQSWPLANPDGCEQCAYSGYRGRACLSETLNITPTLADGINRGDSLRDLYEAATDEGFEDFWTQAEQQVRDGHTSWAECLRVLPGRFRETVTPATSSRTLPFPFQIMENQAV